MALAKEELGSSLSAPPVDPRLPAPPTACKAVYIVRQPPDACALIDGAVAHPSAGKTRVTHELMVALAVMQSLLGSPSPAL